jgi:hypothetical protein
MCEKAAMGKMFIGHKRVLEKKLMSITTVST